MSNIITAIDVGSHKVTTVISVLEDDGKIKVIGEASHNSFGIKKGEITGIDEAINSIASSLTGAERMAGLTVSSAYVSINGKNIISNNNKGVVAVTDSTEILEDDVIRSLEQARTVAIPQSREIIHLIPREFVVDQQTGIKNPVSMTGTRLEVDAHIISAPVTSIHNIERCIQNIGLKIDGLVFTGWAAAHSVLTNTEKELGVLLLDIGGGTVSITTFVEDAITYSTSIPFGGSNVTRDLAAGLRLSLDQAEKVKVDANELIKNTKPGKDKKETDIIDVTEYGIDDINTVSKKRFLDIIDARVEEIFELVRDNISQAGYEYQLPAGAVLTGGSASLPGITNIAKKVFGIPARVGNPRGLEGLVDSISTPDYSVTQGMLLYAAQDEGIYSSTSPRFASSGTRGGSSKGIFSGIIKFIKNLLP